MDTIIFRFKFDHHLCIKKYSKLQNREHIKISTRGTKPVSTTLNKSTEGAIPVTCNFGNSQSYERKVSEVDPIICTDPNIWVNEIGNLTLNDIAADIS